MQIAITDHAEAINIVLICCFIFINNVTFSGVVLCLTAVQMCVCMCEGRYVFLLNRIDGFQQVSTYVRNLDDSAALMRVCVCVY